MIEGTEWTDVEVSSEEEELLAHEDDSDDGGGGSGGGEGVKREGKVDGRGGVDSTPDWMAAWNIRPEAEAQMKKEKRERPDRVIMILHVSYDIYPSTLSSQFPAFLCSLFRPPQSVNELTR